MPDEVLDYEEFEELETSEESEEVFESASDPDQLDEEVEESEEVEEVEEIEEASPSPIPVEFSLLVDYVSFDTELNDLGFASVSICICLFVLFMSLGWRFLDK